LFENNEFIPSLVEINMKLFAPKILKRILASLLKNKYMLVQSNKINFDEKQMNFIERFRSKNDNIYLEFSFRKDEVLLAVKSVKYVKGLIWKSYDTYY